MSLSLAVSANQIMVEDKLIASTPELMEWIKKNPTNYLISNLYNDLYERAEKAKQIEIDYGDPFDAEVTVQIDENIPFELLTRILYTCGQAGWSNMKLAVYQPGE